MAGMSLKERTIDWRNLIVWYLGVDCGIILKWVDCENVNRLVVNLCCLFFWGGGANSVESGGFSNQIRKQPSSQPTAPTNKLTARCADFLQLRFLIHLIKTFTVGYLHNEPCSETRKLFMHLWYNPALSTHLGMTLKLMIIRCWVKLISLFPQFVHCRWSIWYRYDSETDIEAWSMLQPNSALLRHMLRLSLFSPPPHPSLSHQFDVGLVSRATAIRDLTRISCIYTFIFYLCMYDMFYAALS